MSVNSPALRFRLINFPLTREEDQDCPQQQVDGRLPPLWNASDGGRNEDFCRDVELQGEGDEDAEAVEQLHGLVRPVSRKMGWWVMEIRDGCRLRLNEQCCEASHS